MSGNSDPIVSRVGQVDINNAVTAANTAKDGTGTVTTVFTADATNGGWCEEIILHPLGTNSTQSVARVFVNNGSTNATAGNNALLASATLPTTTNSETAAIPSVRIPIRMALPPGYKLNVALGTAGTAGWSMIGVGGKY